MKLASYEWRGERHIGLSIEDKLFSLTQALGASDGLLRSMAAFLADERKVAQAADFDRRIKSGALASGSADAFCARSSVRLLPPVPDPEKIICIGLNYIDHARESGMEPPPQPVFFAKYRTALNAPDDPVRIPPTTQQVDFEAELAIVVGRRGKYIPEARAMDYVAGYMVFHDVSARDLQFKTSQWINGKTLDSFAPCGPFLVTKDEVPDPHGLGIRLTLNGAVMQNSNTSNLIFRVPQLIAHLSNFFTLTPGDFIASGTPPGVGFARKPPVFLKPGDHVRIEIDGVGVLEHGFVKEEE